MKPSVYIMGEPSETASRNVTVCMLWVLFWCLLLTLGSILLMVIPMVKNFHQFSVPGMVIKTSLFLASFLFPFSCMHSFNKYSSINMSNTMLEV